MAKIKGDHVITDDEMIEFWRGKYGPRIDQAVRIYDEILGPICGSYRTKGGKPNTLRQQFIQWFASGSFGKEFRFQGDLGMGGKFWDIPSTPWHVNYYSEDRSKRRDQIEQQLIFVVGV